jgi:hypothetical protein
MPLKTAMFRQNSVARQHQISSLIAKIAAKHKSCREFETAFVFP